MDNYSAGSYAGRGFYRNRVHIGEDAVGPEGGAVRAVADGQIVHYGAASGYGELVVVIEHNLGSPRRMTLTVGHAKTVETRYVCTIYGHLRKSARRGGPALSWRVGQNVRRGDVIGYINDDAHNGDGREHLHMGCRLSARTSGWGYYGYEGRSYPLSNVRYFGAYSEVARLLGW
ncbi:MAG: M23 family metallopeptidase [Armatimonadetes bacterium]|nr:M23 family metallopeptidase [Armatimonadota bacterium]